LNYLLVESLQKYHHYYGEDFKVEFPARSGNESDLWEVAAEISRRLVHIFVRGKDGRRPVAGGAEVFQKDPHWRDLLLFYEYFHGDNGAGLGANHQTGWTGVIARAMHLFATTTADQALELGKVAAHVETESPQNRTSESPRLRTPSKSPTDKQTNKHKTKQTQNS
jgi:hypothetical protein